MSPTNTPVFITATEARQNPIREYVVHEEARGIESAILNAVSLGFYEVNVSNNTPMTDSTAIVSDVWTINTTNNQLTIPNHGFSNGDTVTVSSTMALPAPLVAGQYYYIIYVDQNTVKLASSFANAMAGQPINVIITNALTSITITNAGSGYIQAPVVNIANGSPTTSASAVSYLSTWGNLIAISNNTNGGGYTDLPTVQVTSLGTGATVGTISYLAVSAAIAAAGSNYHLDDLISVVGGSGTATTVRVLSVDSNGAILTISLVNSGSYTTLPSTTAVATSVLPGGGTGCTLNLTMGIQSILIASGGTGYIAPPRVIINSGSGTGATAVSTIYGGQVLSLVVTNPGYGYLGVSSVVMDTGSGATAIATLQPTSVASANVTYDGGNTYTSPPAVTITPFGTGASAGTVYMSVVNVQLVSGGSGYSVGDSLLISGGTGTVNAWIIVVSVSVTGTILTYVLENGGNYTSLPGLVANPVVGGNGMLAAFNLIMGVSNITVSTSGTGYEVPPIVTIDVPSISSGQAFATAQLTSGNVSSFIVGTKGSFYTVVPNVTVANGSGATASSYLTPTTLNAISVGNPGTGYSTANVVISGGGASSQATAIANISGGSIANIMVTNSGVGYTTLPVITIVGDGNNATATASLNLTSVGGINILNNGAGYNAPPAISIVGTATANAIISSTGVESIVVTGQGQNYVTAPEIFLIPGTFQQPSAIPTPPVMTAQLAFCVSNISITCAGVAYLTTPNITMAGPYYSTGNTATATATIGAGSGTFALMPYPSSRDYYKAWQNQNLSNNQLARPYTERMHTIINYFTNMGYTINRVTNPQTNSTFMWSIKW